MKYIRTKDGKIFDIEKIKQQIKSDGYYKKYKFGKLIVNKTLQELQLKWTCYDGNNDLCHFGIGLNCDSIEYKQAYTIEELICDGDILYLHDLYPDAVLVVEGNIKPFGYPKAIKLKEWLAYKHIKFDLLIKDNKGNYIKVATTNDEGKLELL